MSKISGYVKTFKVEDRCRFKNNKLMSFRIDDDKLLQRYKVFWTKNEDSKNIKSNVLSVYDDKYMKIIKKKHVSIKFMLTFVV